MRGITHVPDRRGLLHQVCRFISSLTDKKTAVKKEGASTPLIPLYLLRALLHVIVGGEASRVVFNL